MKKLSAAALLIGAVFSYSTALAADAQITDKKFIDDSSYAVGVSMGKYLESMLSDQKNLIKLDKELLLKGVKDAVNGKVTLTNEQLQQQNQALFSKIEEIKIAKAQELAQQAKTKGDAFRADYAKKDGVKQTQSGILYKIEKAGEGGAPKPEDTVKVHYTGKLVDGTVFDSSAERGQPAEFTLSQLIPGWTEGIALIKKGGKIELVLPPELAYGKQGAGDAIPGNSTLIFDIELLDVTPAAEAVK
ncbi:FKBP-type peptidyl-prolyl cis-trans isomerase FkpA [Cricetibacter osteomyelitidis]|uniref:Peptidyl-prolyl cis-trans isomerase n=1 Tax=Cricetibacter osteomyelitidis TaxID=1521931 RepID=A0A4R2T8L8_9PAST|nr:FKBP-type peptidyl-prolyl cis-trans isomerase [Cricetibacter osteomyelitidis]TCP97214.1 FKBP-type peptidyl-prolyl cis-trans isomerase FkpA [Cricetibacter osteomyelitidis]